MTLELPAGFNVSPEQPYRYHIFFSDRDTRSELEPVLLKLVQAWNAYVASRRDEITNAVKTPGVTQEAMVASLYDGDFARNADEYRQAWDLLSRKNYWESGGYRMRFVVHTTAPDKQFEAEWRFTLTNQDFEILRLNAVVTPQELCIGQANYNFAYPDYQ